MFEPETWESDAQADALNDTLFGGGKLVNLTRLEKKLKKRGLITSPKCPPSNGKVSRKGKLKAKSKLEKAMSSAKNESCETAEASTESHTPSKSKLKKKRNKNDSQSCSAKSSVGDVSCEDQSCESEGELHKSSKISKKNKYKHLAGLSKSQKLDYLNSGSLPPVSVTQDEENSLKVQMVVENTNDSVQQIERTKKRKSIKEGPSCTSNKKKAKLNIAEMERIQNTGDQVSGIKTNDSAIDFSANNSAEIIKKKAILNKAEMGRLQDTASESQQEKPKKKRKLATGGQVSGRRTNDSARDLSTNKSSENVHSDISKADVETIKKVNKKHKQKSDKPSSTSLKPTVRKVPFSLGKLKDILEHSKPKPTPRIIKSTNDAKAPSQKVSPSVPKKAVSLRDKMKERLNSARFRYINEQLYTGTGMDAKQLFEDDQEAFQVYHEGFQSQVVKWPVNPVDKMIEFIKERPISAVIGDFGCGEAQIAQSVKNKVHSFDLVAVNEHITACDIAHIPLPASSIDIGVFCLSLMGTNLTEFVCEANRVVKKGGILLIAEVISRFEKVGNFVRKMEKLGFKLDNKNSTNKMFIWFEFHKSGTPDKSRLPELELAPCLYKRR